VVILEAIFGETSAILADAVGQFVPWQVDNAAYGLWRLKFLTKHTII
jgi:hypothetical protein